MKYTVTNIYGIAGESNHRTAEAALKAAGKRECYGWVVVDDEGNYWGWYGDEAEIIRRADD